MFENFLVFALIHEKQKTNRPAFVEIFFLINIDKSPPRKYTNTSL